jgi:hypothetical protein
MNVEPTHNRLAGDFDLELLIDMVFIGLSATLGAPLRQWHIDDLVGFLLWKRAIAFGAVVVARLAARSFRVLLGFPFGERSGLAFLGARGLLQELLEFSDPPFELGTVGTLYSCDCIASHNTGIGKMAA